MYTIFIKILKVEHLINLPPTQQHSHRQNDNNQQQTKQQTPYG